MGMCLARLLLLCGLSFSMASAQPISKNIIGMLGIPNLIQWAKTQEGIDPKPGVPLKLCERPDLRSKCRFLSSVEDLDWVELGYESDFSIAVIGKRGKWLRIGLKEGSAWIQRQPNFEFGDINEFFEISRNDFDLTYLTDESDSKLSSAPGRVPRIQLPEGYERFRIVDRFLLKGEV
jgi:hypothetical protein